MAGDLPKGIKVEESTWTIGRSNTFPVFSGYYPLSFPFLHPLTLLPRRRGSNDCTDSS